MVPVVVVWVRRPPGAGSSSCPLVLGANPEHGFNRPGIEIYQCSYQWGLPLAPALVSPSAPLWVWRVKMGNLALALALVSLFPAQLSGPTEIHHRITSRMFRYPPWYSHRLRELPPNRVSNNVR